MLYIQYWSGTSFTLYFTCTIKSCLGFLIETMDTSFDHIIALKIVRIFHLNYLRTSPSISYVK